MKSFYSFIFFRHRNGQCSQQNLEKKFNKSSNNPEQSMIKQQYFVC
ncbi:unnamed protein product [Paramecium primaurelia]|uniref:Uncharacterized protein n=1 Tax=Paramecium primaurelia TaxID=5886 RepID=A0A8S1MQL8_PARPR|nr:unnamed protein product [Paramecium primaurelia]